MRIVSGLYKGRKFTGTIPSVIRPTTDNVRESIFNILGNYINFEEIVVADICAGTGFLGFEALSRGAKECYFFEKSKNAIKLILETAKNFNLTDDDYQIVFGDAVKTFNSFKNNNSELQFGLIFFDPPYNSNLYDPIIQLASISDSVPSGSVFIIEHISNIKLMIPANMEVLTKREYGGTGILFLKKK